MGSKSSGDEGDYVAPEVPATPPYEFSFAMPDMGAYQADMQAQYEQQKKDAEIADAEAQIKDMYTTKFDAADKATSDVNKQIADEMAHAKTLGLDYSVDETGKQERINNAFADYWGAGDEDTLNGLVTKYGNAGVTWDLPIVRGQSTEEKAKEKTPGDKAGESVGIKKKGAGQKGTTDQDPLGLKTLGL